MSYRNVLLVLLSCCPLLLIMGGLDRRTPQPTRLEQSAFVAKSIQLEPLLAVLGPAQLLRRAAEALAPEKVPWLRVKIWQRQESSNESFEAEGCLVRGPHHCVFLDMKIQSGKQTSTVVTVSDGVGVAHACRAANKKADITSQRFVTSEGQPMSDAHIDKLLIAHGCGGPGAQLQELNAVLQNLHMETGSWKEKAVLKVTGSAKEKARCLSVAEGGASPDVCSAYLDARTLWPHRIEWGSNEANAPLFLEVEYREPEINQPLSHEECIRAFTYTPD